MADLRTIFYTGAVPSTAAPMFGGGFDTQQVNAVGLFKNNEIGCHFVVINIKELQK